VHGNNKSRQEVERALHEGVHRLVVDNFDEIDLLGSLVSAQRPLNCLVRVTPGVEAHTHEFVRTGQEDTKFGFSVATGEARTAIDSLRAIPGLTLHGVHAHIGSQIFEVDGYRETMGILAAFTKRRRLRRNFAWVAASASRTCTARPRSRSASGARPFATRRSSADSKRAYASSPSRVGPSCPGGHYPLSRGCDQAGRRSNVHGGRWGHERQSEARALRVGLRGLRRRTPSRESSPGRATGGKHCESGDVLVDEAWLPAETGVHSVIATPVTGAYGYSMASNYNRVPRPAVVFVADGTARLVLRRETFDDLARLET